MSWKVDARMLRNYERAAQIEYHVRGFTDNILAKAARHVSRDELLPKDRKALDRTMKGLMRQWVTAERDFLAGLRRLAGPEADSLASQLDGVENLIAESLSPGALGFRFWELRAAVHRYGEAIDISRAAAEGKIESIYMSVFER